MNNNPCRLFLDLTLLSDGNSIIRINIPIRKPHSAMRCKSSESSYKTAAIFLNIKIINLLEVKNE